MLELLAAILDIAADGYGTSSQHNDIYDEDMYANTDAWRSLHPYDYNPLTGGNNIDEDEENGW